MKVARASQADMDAAMQLYQLLSAVDDGHFPPRNDDEDWPEFDEDCIDHLQSFLERALNCLNHPPSGLMRVLMAASCALDPANKLYDPAKSYIDFHPRIAIADDLLALLIECDEYLNINNLTSIGHGSILHRKMKDLTAKAQEET